MQFVHNEETRVMLDALRLASGVYRAQNAMDAGNEVHGTVLVVTEYNIKDMGIMRQWVSGVLNDEYFTTNTIEFIEGEFVITNKNSGPTLMIEANGSLEQAVEGWNTSLYAGALSWYYHIEVVKLQSTSVQMVNNHE